MHAASYQFAQMLDLLSLCNMPRAGQLVSFFAFLMHKEYDDDDSEQPWKVCK